MSKNVQVVGVIALLVGISVIGMVLALWGSYDGDTKDKATNLESESYIIKDQLGEFKLTEKITGEDALEQINHLHGQNIDIDGAYILHYEGKDGFAIVWISKSTVKEDAERMFHEMNDLMGGSQMYQGHTEIDVNGKKIQYVYGMNMDNYYYFIENRVIWIAITGDKDEFLKEAIRSF